MHKDLIVTIILGIIFILFIYYFVILQRKSFLTPQLPELITEEELTPTQSITLTSTQPIDNSLIIQQKTSSALESESLKATFSTSSF